MCISVKFPLVFVSTWISNIFFHMLRWIHVNFTQRWIHVNFTQRWIHVNFTWKIHEINVKWDRNTVCVNSNHRHWSPTWLSQHVGEADILADDAIQIHPEWHRVQLCLLMKLVQENLFTDNNALLVSLNHS